MMRGTPGMRLALAILSPLFLLLWVVAIYSEETRPWMRYQEQFNRSYVARARTKLEEARSRNDEKEMARWQRAIDEFSAAEPEIQQVYLDDINVADRCTTCHRGIDNVLFEDASEPFRTHPGDTLKYHDFNSFGCTTCHQGQGVATSADAAHGKEEHWLKPLLPPEYVQANCAQCHEVTHGVAGAEVISRGADLFMESGCYGCHEIKDYTYQPRFSPPLNDLGTKLQDRKTFLYDWVKKPKDVSPDTAMPDFLLDDEELGKITAFLLTLPPGKALDPVSLEDASEENGKRLFEERGCRGCHAIKNDEHSVASRVPHLAGIGSKVTKDWLYAWIKDPKALNPDTAMPRLQLVNLTAVSLDRTQPADQPADPNGASPATVGAEATPTDPNTTLSPEPAAPPADPNTVVSSADAGQSADPNAESAETEKLQQELEDKARRDLVAYLMSIKREKELPAPPDLSGFDAREGEQLVKKYECFGCHQIQGFEKARPGVPDLTEFARRPVDELDFGTTSETEVPRTKWDWLRHKLPHPRDYERKDIVLYMPAYDFSEEDAHAVIAFSMSLEKPALPGRYVVRRSDALQALRDKSWLVQRFNCRGCHRLDDRQDSNIAQYLERKSFAGPNLKGVGARLQGQYLYDFVLEPKQVRPWLLMRMPTFGFPDELARTLVAGFAADVRVVNPYTYVAEKVVQDEHFQRGVRRFRHYKCMQCHPTSLDQGLPEDVDPEDLSINLMLTKERCRPEWLDEFMRRPKDIAGTDTRMPTVFYTVDGIPKVEKPDQDIADITTYLMGMTEPPEVTLAAEEEAIKKEEKEEDIDWTEYQD